MQRRDHGAAAVAQRRQPARPLLLLAEDAGVVDGKGGRHGEEGEELLVLVAEAAHVALLGAAQQPDELAAVHQRRHQSALLVPARGFLALAGRPVVPVELALEEPGLIDVGVVAGAFIERDREAKVLLVLGRDVHGPVAGGDHVVVRRRVVEDVGGKRPHRLGGRARDEREDVLQHQRRGHGPCGFEKQRHPAVLLEPGGGGVAATRTRSDRQQGHQIIGREDALAPGAAVRRDLARVGPAPHRAGAHPEQFGGLLDAQPGLRPRS